jgi:glycosyltransferase involved in cell wall biosynthesis
VQKILHWNPRFGNFVGGGETYIANIIQHMQEFNQYVVSDKYYPGNDKEFYNDFKKNILYSIPPRIYNLGFVGFPLNILSEKIRLYQKKKLIKKVNPDLTIIHGLGIFGFLESLNHLLGIYLIERDYFQDFNPRILTVHNLYSLVYNDYKYSSFEKRIFEQFDTYVCIDKYIYSFLKEKYPSKEIYYVPNSVPDYFLFNDYTKHQYHPKSPILGFVGRYDSSKGIHILEKLIEKSPENFKFILVFSTNITPQETIVMKFKAYKNVKLFFDIPNTVLSKYYKKMDFLFNPVIDEGISRVSLEAMANGIVPIMKDLGDRYPVIDLETGILYKENNLEALIKKIDKLNSKEYNEIQKKAKEIIKLKFSNESIIPQLKEIYLKHIK